MGKNNFATILIRILSIYFIVQSIGSLSNLGWIFTFDEMKNSPEYTFSLTNLISFSVLQLLI